jgi:hypothetical protein
MIRDETYEFLCSVRLARMEIRRCRETVAELEDSAARITTAWKDVPGGGGDVHKDATLIALADQRRKLLGREQEYARRLLEVEAFIREIPDPTYRAILELRYVRLLSWPRIVDELWSMDAGLNYSESHVFRLHGRALVAARKLWAEKHKEVQDG